MARSKSAQNREDLLNKLSREFLETEIMPITLSPEREREIRCLEKENEIREWLSQRSKLARAS